MQEGHIHFYVRVDFGDMHFVLVLVWNWISFITSELDTVHQFKLDPLHLLELDILHPGLLDMVIDGTHY